MQPTKHSSSNVRAVIHPALHDALLYRLLLCALLIYGFLALGGCGDGTEIAPPLLSGSAITGATPTGVLAAPPPGKGYNKNQPSDTGTTSETLNSSGELQLLGSCYFPIGPWGGFVNVGSTKLSIPAGALDQTVGITMEVYSDGTSQIEYRFDPHGTVFAIPAQLELAWDVLKGVKSQDLTLYYYDEQAEAWVEETHAQWDDKHRKATLAIPHFSRYYFERR